MNYYLLKEGTQIKRLDGYEWELFVTTRFAIFSNEDIAGSYESPKDIDGEYLSSRSLARRKLVVKVPTKSFPHILVNSCDMVPVSQASHYACPKE